MDSRERVFRALERTQPDRLPIFQQLLPGARLQYGPRLDELLARYPSDFRDCGYYGDYCCLCFLDYYLVVLHNIARRQS